MKRILSVLLIFSATTTMAQQQSAVPETASLTERLIQLAMQNPENEIADLQTKIAHYEVSRAKAGWLNNFHISGNVNEFSLKKQNANALYYPKYNVGVTLPLGFFTTTSNDVKIAKANVRIADAKKNSTYRQIRAAVLSSYQDYLMYKELLTLQSQVTETEYNGYLKIQSKFSNGEIPIEEYSSAAKNYNAVLASKVKAQHDFNVSKLALEQLIGVSLDEVLAQYQPKK